MMRLVLVSTGAALLLAGLLAPAPGSADEIDDVDEFLDRMGLVDLRVLHLEQSLGALSEPRRASVSRRLADLYSDQLIRRAEDAEAYADIQRRMRRLLESAPEANTPSVQVMLLQADFNRAESIIAGWIEEPARDPLRADALQILARVAPELDRMRRQLSEDVDRFMRQVEIMEPGDAQQTAERELDRRRSILARAIYFSGWSSYYLALAEWNLPAGPAAAGRPAANPTPPGTGPLAVAEASFRQLLEIEDTPAGDVPADWLGLDSVWRARATVGLGLTFAARGAADACNICFQWLRGPAVHPLVADQVDYWQFRAWMNAGRYPEALAVARDRSAAIAGSPTQGKVSFCVAMVRGGWGVPASERRAEHVELGRIGITGLARLGETGIISQLLEKYAIEIPDDAGLVLLSIRGTQEFARAEQSRRSEDYRRATDTLTAAMSSGDLREVRVAGRCQYTLAWSHYRSDEFDAAARQFQQAASRLKAGGDSLAVESLWMAFVCWRRLARDDDRFVAAATETATALEREHPGHAHTLKAQYHLSQLVAGGSPQQLVARLGRVRTDDPAFPEAGYDLCVLLHRACREATGDDLDARRTELEDAVERYVAAGDEGRRPRVLLMLVDAWLARANRNPGRAQQYLDRVAAIADVDQGPAGPEYHYWRMELAVDAGDAAAGRAHAQWLVENARGTAFELPGLVALLRSDPPGHTPEPDGAVRGHAWCSRLVELLGDSPEQLRETPNAQVAISRLAHYAYVLGRHHEAAERLGKLLSAFPTNQDYLRRAGLASFEAKLFEQSMVHWRTILSGTESGSAAWYEAKYYQLACLVETDRDRARQVFQQLRLLHPDFGPPPWRERLEQLERRVS